MTRLGNWWRYAHRRGLADSIRAFVTRFVFRASRCVITYSPAAGPPAVDHVGAVTFRVATPADFDRLEELERYNRGSIHRRYVDRDNDWLVVACDGDRIVATRRAGLVIRDSVVSRVLRLGPRQFWGADVFCVPEYRNQGIGRHLQVFGDRYLASLGYEDRFGAIDARNTASLRTSRAAGRRALYYVSFLKVLWWERLCVSSAVPSELWEPRSLAVRLRGWCARLWQWSRQRVSALVDRWIYHSYRCLVVYSPTDGSPVADRVGDITYRVATPADLECLEELERHGRGSTHRRYIEKDSDCLFVACHGERIVATRRAARVIRDALISQVIQLRRDQYWGADVFCLPEYRNRGIARHLQAFGDRYFASLGVKHRLGTIAVGNTASVSMNRATGTRPIYYVVHRRILFWRSLRVTKDVPERVWGASRRRAETARGA